MINQMSPSIKQENMNTAFV